MSDLRTIIKELRFRSDKLNETVRGHEKDYHYALTKATANQALEDAEILERFVLELQKEPWTIYTTTERDTIMKVLQRVIGEEAHKQ